MVEIARPGDRPLLLPFTEEAVPEIDIDGGRLVIAPPDEFGEPEQRQ